MDGFKKGQVIPEEQLAGVPIEVGIGLELLAEV